MRVASATVAKRLTFVDPEPFYCNFLPSANGETINPLRGYSSKLSSGGHLPASRPQSLDLLDQRIVFLVLSGEISRTAGSLSIWEPDACARFERRGRRLSGMCLLVDASSFIEFSSPSGYSAMLRVNPRGKLLCLA